MTAPIISCSWLGFGLQMKAMLMRGLAHERMPGQQSLRGGLPSSMPTIVGLCLVIGLWPRLRYVGAFAAPVVFAIGVFALMPGLDTHSAQAAIQPRPGQPARGADPAFLRRVRPQFRRGRHVS